MGSKLRAWLHLVLYCAVVAPLATATPSLAYTQGDPEVRGMWVQNAGYGDPGEATTTINQLASGNFNVICPYARWYGMLFFAPQAPNAEPIYSSSNFGSGMYALDDIITKAHAKGIKVYAWFWANNIAATQYSNPSHVMNRHPEWLMKTSIGDVCNWLDPGVPDAMTWNYNVAMDLVQHHDIDGLHFDYIRYPGWGYGYNDIAIARFNEEYGRTGLPATDNADFVAWRKRQVTDFVKKVYANAAAVKPNVCISAAVYGKPSNGESKLQDWDVWMQKGYLDMAVPMIYEPAGASYWYSCLSADQTVLNAYGRSVVIGQGGGDNSISGTVQQMNEVRDYGFPGEFVFSYTTSNNEGATISTFCTSLAANPQAYSTPVSLPAMPWKTAEGVLKGTVTGQSAAPVYNATITLGGQTDLTDATGFYALMKLGPGSYTATCSASGYVTASAPVTISGGVVTTADFALIADGAAPVISNIQATNVWSTLATISWSTDEQATGQIEYGLTTAYGSETAVNTARLTAHSFPLTGLSPAKTYHYRVKSTDGTGNAAVSPDHTFTTGGLCAVEDIIIDNNNANNAGGSSASSSGSWTVASNLGGKYADNYAYIAHVAPPGNAWFRWTPNVLVPGTYNVYVWYTSDPAGSHSTGAPYTVSYSGGSQTFQVNQHVNTGRWNLVGSFDFSAGTSGYVQVGNGTDASGTYVMADAVKLSYVCERVAPTIGTIDIQPPLVEGGAPVEIAVSATDNVEVNTVYAGGTRLNPVGGATYLGAFAADLIPGPHSVTVVATDTAGNVATDSTHSYRTARIVALTSNSLVSAPAVIAGSDKFLYKSWGYVTVVTTDLFGIDDGSNNPVLVHCPGHGLTTGRFVTVYGEWKPPVLESRPAQIQVVF